MILINLITDNKASYGHLGYLIKWIYSANNFVLIDLRVGLTSNSIVR